jgi:hypothetical protein
MERITRSQAARTLLRPATGPQAVSAAPPKLARHSPRQPPVQHTKAYKGPPMSAGGWVVPAPAPGEKALQMLRLAQAVPGASGVNPAVKVKKSKAAPDARLAKYADDEGDDKAAALKEAARVARRALSRRNLVAEHFASELAASSLALIVHGDLSLKLKLPLAQLGFRAHRFPCKLIKVAAAKLDGGAGAADAEHMRVAERLSRGLSSLVYTRQPLLELARDSARLAELQRMLPLGAAGAEGDAIVVGGLIRDQGKTESNIWLTRPGVGALLEQLNKEALAMPSAETPHIIFHAKLVAALQGHMGAFRGPLLAPAMALQSALSAAPQQLATTLAMVEHQRKTAEPAKSEQAKAA